MPWRLRYKVGGIRLKINRVICALSRGHRDGRLVRTITTEIPGEKIQLYYCDRCGASYYTIIYEGYIGKIYFWDKALTAGQIACVCNVIGADDE